MTVISRIALAALVVVSLSAPAAAQNAITAADIQRLQDNVYLAERDVQQARGRDTARANQLQLQVDELKDEVIYLKVKLRKERNLTRTEFADVRDRIEDLRSRARGDATGPYSLGAPSATAPPARAGARTGAGAGAGRVSELPAGTELDVRLSNTLDSETALVEDRFEATTVADVVANGRTVIPAGSVMRGIVTAVEKASRTNRTSRLSVSFDQVTVAGRSYPLRGTVTEALEAGGVKDEAGRTAAGAGVGAIIGGILGGVKGAVIGGVIGGGGTIAATEGKDVELPQGTILRVRIDSPVTIR